MAPKRRRRKTVQFKPDATSQKRTKFQHTHHNTTTAETVFACSQSSKCNTTQLEQPISAATQAFATTELLEQILLAVNDVKSLMLLRRVASRWRAVIDDTASLRKKMWLAPQQLDHEWYLSPGAVFLCKRPIAAGGVAAAADSGDVIYKSGMTNPFLFDQRSSRLSPQPIWTSYFHDSWVSSPLFVRKAAKSKLRRARSLFLKMFATQPPVPVMYLRIRGGESELSSYRSLIEQVKNPKGVKVGDVLRAVSHLSDSQKTAFVVDEMMFDLEWAKSLVVQPWSWRRFGHEI